MSVSNVKTVAEFKEFNRRFKFKPRFKYGWFHLKLYQLFQDLSRRFLNRVLTDLNRGSNSLNSISGELMSDQFLYGNSHDPREVLLNVKHKIIFPGKMATFIIFENKPI